MRNKSNVVLAHICATVVKCNPLCSPCLQLQHVRRRDVHHLVVKADIPVRFGVWLIIKLVWKTLHRPNPSVGVCVVDGRFKQPHLQLSLWGWVRLHTCGALSNQSTQDKNSHTHPHFNVYSCRACNILPTLVWGAGVSCVPWLLPQLVTRV